VAHPGDGKVDPTLYLAFAAAAVLIAVPGPNVACILSAATRHGARAGLLTVAGTSTGMLVQLVVAGAGVGLVASLAGALEWLRWAGAAYLIFLGVREWRRAGHVPDARMPPGANLFGRGLLVAVANPKTLLFYAAFLPQFVDPAGPLPVGWQLGVLAGTFLALAAAIDGLYAIAGGRARAALQAHALRLWQRLSGAFLVAAGVGLTLARR